MEQNTGINYCVPGDWDSVAAFEEGIKQLQHGHCELCHSVSLSINPKMYKGKSMCQDCRGSKFRKDEDQLSWLPVWYDDHDNVRYDLPVELQDLREGEKLLLQQLSPYIPLQHLQHGSYGSKGHVCCFPQRVDDICRSLPRQPNDVRVVRVVKHFRKKNGDTGSTTFRIRRQKVMDALRWLKKYNYH
jgi:hypothetical protein